MESFLKFISPYELRARTLPGMLMTAPIMALIAALLPMAHSWQGLTAAVISWIGVSYPIGQWMRDVAQPRQAALLNAWGGAPTTQILRWSDTTLTAQEKMIARNQMLRLGEFSWPNADQENENPAEADAQYHAIVGAILSAARGNSDRYERMDRASAHFGFQRNCYYLRLPGASIAAMALIFIGACLVIPALPLNPAYLIAAEGLCFAVLMFWTFGVSTDRLRTSADAFAIEVFRHIPIYVDGSPFKSRA